MGKSLRARRLADFLRFIEDRISVGVGTKIFIPFFTVTFITIGVLSYFVLDRISEKIVHMEERKAEIVLNSTLQLINQQKQFLELNTRLLADSPELEQALAGKNSKQLYELLTPAKYYSKYDNLAIFDRDEKIVVKLGGGLNYNSKQREGLKLALTGVTYSDLRITERGLEIYSFTPINFDPVKFFEKMPVGALVVTKCLGNQELKELGNLEGIEINIIKSGSITASTHEGEQLKDVAFWLKNHYHDSFAQAHVDKVLNTEYINVGMNIDNEGGEILIMVPNTELAAIRSSLSGDIYGIAVLAVVLVLACSFYLAKVIIRPLVRLAEITTAITQGDFTQKAEVYTRDEFGRLTQAVNYMADKIRERLETAEHLATIDGLTGMYNHRYFQQRLQQEMERSERFGAPLSLVMIDIDYFKHYNDLHGHPAGDRVLKEISTIIQKNVRGVDVAARYGGEEFAIILTATAPENALEVGERIRREVEGYPFEGRQDQPTGKVTISMGIACYPLNAICKEELIKMADDALYRAKFISKNRVMLYYSVLDELKSELDKSEHDLLNTIKTLVSVINSKDKYTFGHSERVVQYSVRVAEAMRLPEQQVRAIKVGAYLHDIGKIEIDRELLNKELPLQAEERETLNQHPSWGAQIASSVKSLKEIVPIILYHHESFDGSGYPIGIRGQEIPLAARILKVADSFDAMTTSRPYQTKKSLSEAKDELLRCAGTEFDPEVVEVFVSLLESPDICDGRLIS